MTTEAPKTDGAILSERIDAEVRGAIERLVVAGADREMAELVCQAAKSIALAAAIEALAMCGLSKGLPPNP